MSRQNVAVLFGGQSSEHEVSLLSASNVLRDIPKKYNTLPIGIKKDGTFLFFKRPPYFFNETNPKKIRLASHGEPISFVPGPSKRILFLKSKKQGPKIDVIFPILHGVYGEDGTIQGLAELLGIPCVGATVLGSAIGMEKDVAKRLLREADIAIADFLVYRKFEQNRIIYATVTKKLGSPFFVKPATAGSSVGVHKVKTKKEFSAAIANAFLSSPKIIIEKFVDGLEVECSVLGNEKPIVSLPGSIVPRHEFYSYEAKYLDDHGAVLQIPAKLPMRTIQRIQSIVLKTYKTLECSGMARVDGFLKKDGQFLINEINTIPGFTNISMYPKLWEVSRLSYQKLLDRLIQLAL